MQVRTLVAAGAIAVVSATGGAVAAQASSSTYSTSTRTETIYNTRCIHTHTHTVRYYSWSSKLGRYVLLSRPSVTNSDSYRCHT